MGTIEELEAISSTVVRRLRRQKLDNGQPFLIWSNKLPQINLSGISRSFY